MFPCRIHTKVGPYYLQMAESKWVTGVINPYNWRYPVNSPVEGTVVYPIIYNVFAYVPGGCFLGFLVAINSTCNW